MFAKTLLNRPQLDQSLAPQGYFSNCTRRRNSVRLQCRFGNLVVVSEIRDSSRWCQDAPAMKSGSEGARRVWVEKLQANHKTTGVEPAHRRPTLKAINTPSLLSLCISGGLGTIECSWPRSWALARARQGNHELQRWSNPIEPRDRSESAVDLPSTGD